MVIMKRLLFLVALTAPTTALRLDAARPLAGRAALAAFAASAIVLAPPCFAEPPVPPAQALPASAADAASAAAPPPQPATGRLGESRAVMATPEEAAELKRQADLMPMPDVPAGSDLDLILSGQAAYGTRVSSPLSHGS